VEASTQHSCASAETRKAALKLGFGEPLSPLAYESKTDEQLLPEIQALAPAASREQCLEAIAMVRRLCALVCAYADIYRKGGRGEGESVRAAIIEELARRIPGFSHADYEAAFNAGLIWTAF